VIFINLNVKSQVWKKWAEKDKRKICLPACNCSGIACFGIGR